METKFNEKYLYQKHIFNIYVIVISNENTQVSDS